MTNNVSLDFVLLEDLTCEEYDTVLSEFCTEQGRPLTKSEEACIKAQRRRIKNKESARKSREIRKKTEEQLLSELAALMEENERLRADLKRILPKYSVVVDPRWNQTAPPSMYSQ